MAAIASIDATQPGSFAATVTTLSSDDTITFTANKKQLVVFRNTTGGSLTATIDGSAGTTVVKQGLGSVSVAAGYAIVVGAGLSVAVVLSSISDYCQGVVHITGASGLTVQVFDL